MFFFRSAFCGCCEAYERVVTTALDNTWQICRKLSTQKQANEYLVEMEWFPTRRVLCVDLRPRISLQNPTRLTSHFISFSIFQDEYIRSVAISSRWKCLGLGSLGGLRIHKEAL